MTQSQQFSQSNQSQVDGNQTNLIAQRCRYQHDQEIGLTISRCFKSITKLFKHNHSFQHAVTR